MTSPRIWLPVGAVLAVAAVLATMLLAGGADYKPTAPADPCSTRTMPVDTTLEGLAQRVVLTGLDEAACDLSTTRERLLLALADKDARAELAASKGMDDAALAALLVRSLDNAVTRLDEAGELPKVSTFKSEVIDQLGASALVKGVLEQIPDSTIDELLPTAAVLRRSIAKIQTTDVLDRLDDPSSLEPVLKQAVREGAVEEARAQLIEKLPGPLKSLF